MQIRRIIALSGTTFALVLTPLLSTAALAADNQVTVRVEGTSRTLLPTTTVQTHTGSIREGGTPPGDCPATSAAGALDVATHHRWRGMFYASVPGIFVTSIFGEKATGSDYWTVFVDNQSSSLGICSLKLHRGEQLLFAVTNGNEYPIVLAAPKHATTNHSFEVKVSYYAKGVAKPLAGVSVNGANTVSNRSGIVTITPKRVGKLTLKGTRSGYVRSAAATVTVAS